MERSTRLITFIGAVFVGACGGGSSSDSNPLIPNGINVDSIPNAAPQITSLSSANVVENQLFTSYKLTAEDADGDELIFSITGGEDGSAFHIVGNELVFNYNPDFENPADADRDNIYEVKFRVIDERNVFDLSSVALKVSDAGPSVRTLYPLEGSTLSSRVGSITVTGEVLEVTQPDDPGLVYVNGVLATFDLDSPKIWRAEVPTDKAAAEIPLEIRYLPPSNPEVRVTRNISNQALPIGSTASLGTPSHALYDEQNDTVYLLTDYLTRLDLNTGERFEIGRPLGEPTNRVSSPGGIALDRANNRILVTDSDLERIISIDLRNGDRTVLVRNNGFGLSDIFGDLGNPRGIAIDRNGKALVMAGGRLVSVDLLSEVITVISSNDLGAGPDFVSASQITYDSSNHRALILNRESVVSVNLSTGDRTAISNDTIGSGPTISNANGITLDRLNNRVLIVDDSLLMSVDIDSGSRKVVFDSETDGGVPMQYARTVTLDSSGNRAFITASGTLFIVDLESYERSALLL